MYNYVSGDGTSVFKAMVLYQYVSCDMFCVWGWFCYRS